MALNQLEVQGRPGSYPTAKGSVDGFSLVSAGHASYLQAVLSGNAYCVGDSAGGANPSGLSTAPISVCLFNPKGSGVNAVIWYAAISTAVAPAAIQHVWLAINRDIAAAAVTGTALLTKNALVGNGKAGAVLAFTTATLPAVPVVALVVGAIGTGAITVQMTIPLLGGWLDGALVLAPGGAISFQFSSISGTAANMASWAWEEVPI